MSLHLTAVGLALGDRSLFDDVHLTLAPGERVALVGDNGAGKTSLLRVALGALEPTAGAVRLHGSAALLAQLDGAATAPTNPTPTTLLRRVLDERPEPHPGTFDAALRGAGLDPFAPADALSGGERQRARLAALLAAPADVLCLDEPTNHLDAAGIAWLVERLRSCRAALLVVDHDRAFLDAIAERTAFLAHGALRVYPGGYTTAAAARAADEHAQRRRHDAQAARHRALRVAADRQRSLTRSAGSFDHRKAGGQATILAKNKAEAVSRTHARASAAMRTRLEREAPEPKPFEDRRRLRLHAGAADPGPSEVLVVRALDVVRAGRTLVAGLELIVRRGERLAIHGPNGSGKTTLLEVLTGQRTAAAGSVRRGLGLALSYVAQADRIPASTGFDDAVDASRDASSGASSEASVGERLRAERPTLSDSEVWEVMAAVGAPCGPERRIATLSGGERQRLELARIAVTPAHALVLDEPTLHLDVRAIEALEALLRDYAGTVLLVSHDAALVDAVATRRLTLDGDGGWALV